MWVCIQCHHSIEDSEDACYHCGSAKTLTAEGLHMQVRQEPAGTGAPDGDRVRTEAQKKGTLIMILLFGALTGGALALLGVVACLAGAFSGWFAARCVGAVLVVAGGGLGIHSLKQLRKVTAAPGSDATPDE